MDSVNRLKVPLLRAVQAEGKYPAYYQNYYSYLNPNAGAEDLLNAYRQSTNFWQELGEDKADYAYEKGKWTLKQMLQHIIDTERVFGYRMLLIARESEPQLQGFDHDRYALDAGAEDRNWSAIVAEYLSQRKSIMHLVASFKAEAFRKEGVMGEQRINLAAIAWVIAGHDLHHQRIVRERYL